MTKPNVLPTMAWSSVHRFRPTPLSFFVLVSSLILCGLGESLIVQSHLGAAPWTVLGLGVTNFSPLSLGLTTFCISFVVLLLWLPLQLKAGLGTVMNVIIIAGSLDVFVPILPMPTHFVGQLLMCALGVFVLGVATCLYLSCQMGAGPRDGLLVGVCQKTGWSVGIVRTAIEASVCLIGYILGGKAGIGTLMVVFGAGWVMQKTFNIMHQLKK